MSQDWGTTWKGPGTKHLGKNLGLGYPLPLGVDGQNKVKTLTSRLLRNAGGNKPRQIRITKILWFHSQFSNFVEEQWGCEKRDEDILRHCGTQYKRIFDTFATNSHPFQVDKETLKCWSTLSYQDLVKRLLGLFVSEDELPVETISGNYIVVIKYFDVNKYLVIKFSLSVRPCSFVIEVASTSIHSFYTDQHFGLGVWLFFHSYFNIFLYITKIDEKTDSCEPVEFRLVGEGREHRIRPPSQPKICYINKISSERFGHTNFNYMYDIHISLIELVDKALGKFSIPEIVKVSNLEGNLNVLELFHGPTLAFKDLAMSCVGQLLEYFLNKRNKHITVIVGKWPHHYCF